MNWDRTEGNRTQFKGNAKHRCLNEAKARFGKS